MTSIAVQAVQHWTSSQVHDTVAAIARQPEFAGSARESLMGRFLRYVMAWIRDLLARYHGSASARYVVIAAIGLIVLVIVARVVSSRELDAQARRLRDARRGTAREDLWIAARRAADEGDYAGACHLLYAAVLERLANLHAVRLHPSKTSGDYWRELRRHGFPAVDDFRLFARRFERAVYGSSTPASDDIDKLLMLADRVLSARRVA